MNEKKKKSKRLNIDITEDQQAALRELLPYGFRQAVFSVLIEDLIRILGSTDARSRNLFLSAVITKRFSFLEAYIELQQKNEQNNLASVE